MGPEEDSSCRPPATAGSVSTAGRGHAATDWDEPWAAAFLPLYDALAKRMAWDVPSGACGNTDASSQVSTTEDIRVARRLDEGAPGTCGEEGKATNRTWVSHRQTTAMISARCLRRTVSRFSGDEALPCHAPEIGRFTLVASATWLWVAAGAARAEFPSSDYRTLCINKSRLNSTFKGALITLNIGVIIEFLLRREFIFCLIRRQEEI